VLDNATPVDSPLESRRDAEDARTAEGLLMRIENQLSAIGVPDGLWPVNVAIGRHADALGDMARAGRASLLLVGLNSGIPTGRIWGRSTAVAVAGKGSIRVLAVEPQAMTLPSCAVVGTVFGPASVNAARAALQCLGPSGSLHLVHVRPPMSHIGTGALSADAAYAQEIADRLQTMAAELGAPAGVRVRCYELCGDPARRLLEVAEQEHADLIAVGTHGRPALGEFLIRSAASRLLGRHRFSVLIASA